MRVTSLRRMADGPSAALSVSGRRVAAMPGLREERTVERGLTQLLTAAALALALALPAGAAEEAKAKAPGVKVIQEPDKVVVRKRTVIDFGDVTVEGELTRPEGSYLLNRSKTRFQSLIKLRDNFNPELQKSADNL
jgi:hypothetical protein